MHRLLLKLFCICNLIIINYAFESGEENFSDHQTYNLNSLFTKSLARLQAARTLKDRNVTFDLKFKGLDPELFENIFQNSSKCVDDIFYILTNIKNEWALSVFDSFGKPQSGILQGHIQWVGDYNECLQVRSTNPNSTIGNFRGKYCVIKSYVYRSLPFPLELGICVPDSCSTTELQSSLELSQAAGAISSSNVTESSITCKPTERRLNAPAKAVIALMSLFCTLAVTGSSITAVKYFMRIIKKSKVNSLIINVQESDHILGHDNNTLGKNSEKDYESLLKDPVATGGTGFSDKLQTFLGCFCVFTNGAKLLNTDSTEGQLLCIHGVRFLSMTWVILGHAYSFGNIGFGNIVEAADLINNFAFQVVLQGFYSVDSFFLLSGFLLTYLTMKEFSKTNGVISWTYFYIHRYIRLTPMYMMVLAFSATLNFYVGSGPFWPDGDFDPVCRDKWWRNLLYINNLNEQKKNCMAWSWYLANDMQFFVISPLFLICLWRWPKIGYGLLAIFLSASWLSNFFITYHYQLPTGPAARLGPEAIHNFAEIMKKTNEYIDKIYIKPYTRICPYIIGMLLGYFLFKRNASCKPKHSLVFICLGWIITTAVTLTCVYGLYKNTPSVLARSFYNALHQSCFAVGLSWVIYVCLIGQGGVVNSILSYKLFIPLSRLTYAVYLIHPMIIGDYFQSLKTSFEFSHPSIVFMFLGALLMTYGLALPVALVFESPFVSLEKLVRKSFSKKDSN